MYQPRVEQIFLCQTAKPRPCHPVLLTPPTQRCTPCATHFVAETAQPFQVTEQYTFAIRAADKIRVSDGKSAQYADAGNETLRFGTGIALTDLDLERSDANLILSLRGSSDQVTLSNWFTDTNRLDAIEFTDDRNSRRISKQKRDNHAWVSPK